MLPHLEALLASLSDRAIPSCQKYKGVASHGRLKRELPHHTPVTAGGFPGEEASLNREPVLALPGGLWSDGLLRLDRGVAQTIAALDQIGYSEKCVETSSYVQHPKFGKVRVIP